MDAPIANICIVWIVNLYFVTDITEGHRNLGWINCALRSQRFKGLHPTDSTNADMSSREQEIQVFMKL